MKLTLIAVLVTAFSSVSSADVQPIEIGTPEPEMTSASFESNSGLLQDEDFTRNIVMEVDRITVVAPNHLRGSIFPIPQAVIDEFCGDIDGCRMRMAMYNWDGTGRTASRSNLFYYNSTNNAWRAEGGDAQGTDVNGTTQHIMQSWSCYFTDGNYNNWKNLGDSEPGFGLLSWNQYNAEECRLTIID
ncbi:hypothetical protein H0A36_22035 [Endozoicomonas sp. SM1973]|uniref:Uncharacterized protein n=1 Tax=Spartinivicinus marinus TaxID=2994442 RepID=A0A853IFE3_9GAMM|nr:hypothetical protein [Spartinivicinus marinus]MCX4026167.1 hypothetical protein [Spartinivicinus marinus]NYZ68701.1 hypothetical protein [Spartinivicinus marinus]